MKKKYAICALAVLSLFACGKEEGKAKLGASKGLPCELLVVCDPTVLKCDLKDSVAAVCEADAPGLGSAENIFRVNNIGTAGYGPTFWAMHSKVFFQIEEGAKAEVGVAYNVKVRPEIEVMVKAGSVEEMRELISTKKDLIQRVIMEFQVNRLAGLVQNKYSRKVSDDLNAVAGYTVKMPTDMVATKRGKDFLWGGSNRNQQDINFVFYTYPWNGHDLADTERFVAKRDSVLQVNIPGSRKDQWMCTSRGEDDEPVLWPGMRKIGDEVVLEVRGLWELHNGYMGGPFIALASIDTAANKVVVREGFVFNPQGQKRDLMRQLEGSLRTLRKTAKTEKL